MPATIRPFFEGDTSELVALFQASVREIASRDYNPQQIQAWAPDLLDMKAFADRCAMKSTWVAEIDRLIVGFSDLEADGHIDMLYVHPAFERQGVARALLEHIENVARSKDIERLYTEASITACPVFEALGFTQIAAQTVSVRGECFTNFRMEKLLAGT